MIDDPQLRELFRGESEEHLQHLDDALLRLEKTPGDKALLEEAFREAHSLKGAARMLGLAGIQVLAHKLEDSLNAARKGAAGLGQEAIARMGGELAEIRRRVAEAVAGPAAAKVPPAAAPTRPSQPAEPPAAAPEPARAPEPAAEVVVPEGQFRIDSVRVDTRKLDSLMTHAGELNVTRTRLARRLADLDQLAEAWEAWARAEPVAAGSPQRARVDEMLSRLRAGQADDSARLDHIASEIADAVREIRLLPLSSLFRIFPREVRELAREQGKEADIVVEGGETVADKRILEEMKDPLTHMIRNAVDHGLEPPEERERAGKPRQGKVRLSASRAAGSVTIEVSDDGRGLDESAIRAVAVRRGILAAEAAADMTTAQLHELVFAHGLSTAPIVTDVSGRGVGLDVVRANVERLKGTIAVHSEAGRGTRIVVRLPVTLATMRALLVTVGGHFYGLPVESVVVARRVPAGDVFTVEGRQAVLHSGGPASVAALADLLEVPDRREPGSDAEPRPCVFLRAGDEVFGVFVDALVDEQEVLLKPPCKLLPKVRNVAGATILSSGDICMVLDPGGLIASLPRRGAAAAPGPAKAAEPSRPKAILLAEDSITTRAQETRILEGAGYEVVATANGLDAFHKLATRPFDAVVTDVNMPHLDGLQLAARIRAIPQYRDLPIILVTSLASEEDKRRGLEVGANAYITKPEFDQRILLECLRRLVG